MFHCPYCGKSNQPAASFCIHCGEPLDEESLAEFAASGLRSAAGVAPDRQAHDREESSAVASLSAVFQSRKIEIVLGLALVVAVVAFALFTYVNQTLAAEHYRAGQDAFARADYVHAASEFA